jgi:putative drug exporter of the RND superfamily
MFGRWGEIVVRRPWWVIGAWLVGAVLIIGFLPRLSDITSADQGSFLPNSYESVQALDLAHSAFPQQVSSTALIVVKRADGGQLTQADQQRVGDLATAIAKAQIHGVGTPVTGPQAVAPNRSVQLISLPITAQQTDQQGQTDAITGTRAVIRENLTGGLSAGVAGDAAQFVDNTDTFTTALAVVGAATFLFIILLVLLIFRSPIAALMPILVIGVVLQVSSNLIATAGRLFGFHVDQSLQTLLLIVLYGIGTDYLLFLLFRYRERLRMGEDKRTAMVQALQRVGEVITSAAAAVIVAFLVLLLASFGAFGSLGPALAIAVFTMLVTALTLVPAVVSLIGPATFWPSKSWRQPPTGTRFQRIGTLIGQRPAVTAVCSGLILLALGAGVLAFKADYDFTAGFPTTTESARATADLQRGFPQGALNPTQAYLTTTTGGTALTQAQLDAFAGAAATAGGVGAVQPPVKSADGRVARFDLLLTGNPVSNEAITMVRDRLRAQLHAAAPPGTRVLVGGITAIFADINSANDRDLSVILPVAALLIAVILALLLRSVVAPVYLVVAVLLNFAATLGAAVYLFQGAAGHPGVTFQLPIVLYLFVLAIGTDYNILMIARLREEARAGESPRGAAALGVEHAGPTVAAAGLILAGTFAALALAPVSFLQQIGFSVAVGILLAAFVMSMFLVPSLTALIGHAAWWPGHGDVAAPNPRAGGRRSMDPAGASHTVD